MSGRKSAGGKKKDDKPPPPTGPGSKIIALPGTIRRHIVKRTEGEKGIDLNFSTTSIKSLPKEIYGNEEVAAFARILGNPTEL